MNGATPTLRPTGGDNVQTRSIASVLPLIEFTPYHHGMIKAGCPATMHI